MKRFLISICALTCLVACQEDDPEVPEPEESAKRTVIVYMAAENSLSSYVDNEIAEMKQGSMTIGNENLILYVDKAESRKPYIIRIKNGEAIDSTFMSEDYLTSDPEKMKMVISQIMAKYPAPEYGLVLWGHADGWLIATDTIPYTYTNTRRKAFGIDSGNNTTTDKGKLMNIPTLVNVINSTMVKPTGKKLKFIFADCCQFQCVENAYELRGVTDYLIGSPAEIPANGAPYDYVVPMLFKQDGYATEIAKTYFEKDPSGVLTPLSVIKTSEVENLAIATKKVLNSFVPTLSFSFPRTDVLMYDAEKKGKVGIIYYKGNFKWGNHLNDNLYDMNDFIRRYASESEYTAWKQAVDQAVIYKNTTVNMNNQWVTANQIDFDSFVLNDERYGGLSMYVPQSRYVNRYNQSIKCMEWYYAVGYEELGW